MKITSTEFETALKDISFPLAIATSGGPDSLALLLLVHDFATKTKKKSIALTVDVIFIRKKSHVS